ncbi:hypothetical protein DFH09DRAFT_1095534 [Mycena vulgaris]|nr:hypothetical protein DFH09DRAFT_1095534 [Mycena vulgaris]
MTREATPPAPALVAAYTALLTAFLIFAIAVRRDVPELLAFGWLRLNNLYEPTRLMSWVICVGDRSEGEGNSQEAVDGGGKNEQEIGISTVQYQGSRGRVSE